MTLGPGFVLGAILVKPILVLGAATLLAAGLRRHSAASRHTVWTVAIACTLALPLLDAVLPPLRVPAISGGAESLLRALKGPAPAPAVMLPESTRSGSSRAGETGMPMGWDTTEGPVERLPQALVALWLIGALLIAARRVAAQIRVRDLVQRARPTSNPELADRFARLVCDLGVRLRVQLRISREAASPAVVGVLRPVVVLPSAAERWSDAEVRAVLIHELGHVVRADGLINLLGDVAGIVYWCNPATWYAIRRLRSEGERACDDRVLQDGAEPEAYADLLLTVAHEARRSGPLAVAATGMARRGELESRLLAVLDAGVRREPLSRWLPTALVAGGLVVAAPTAALTLRTVPPATPQASVGYSDQRGQRPVLEPDRLGDSLARPESERVALGPGAFQLSPEARGALSGPDSVLARQLAAALGHQAEHEGDLVRERAAWALAQARDGRLVEPLLEALNQRDWRVQAYAAWALAPAADPRVVERLMPLLNHPVWRLRAMAASAIRTSLDPRAAAAMTAALEDPAWQVRLQAVEYLAALGGPAVEQRLRPRLQDRHVAVRLAAGQALIPR